jgi:mercuric reductase
VTIDTNGQRHQLSAARLLVAAGRRPNADALGLEEAGVAVDEYGFVQVDDELRTSAKHIFAAGDVIGARTGSQMATPVGAQDGGIAAGNALNDDHRQVNHRVVPRAIFIDPQVGVVGLTDQEANERGRQCVCRTIPMALVPRAGAVRDTRGVIKMVVDRKTREVLGVSMHGLNAAEVIHEAALGLRLGARLEDYAGMVHVYPTMSEALKIVALSFTRNVAKMSCCAE